MEEELGDKAGMARGQGNIANIYASQNDYIKALEYVIDAIKIDEEIEDKGMLAMHIGNAGMYYFDIANNTSGTIKPSTLIPTGKTAILRRAIEYLNKSINIYKKTDDLEGVQPFFEKLSEAQALAGNYKEALESYKQYVLYKDSVFSQENKIKITSLETQRDLDLKDRDIALKNKQLEIDRLAVAKKRNERGFFIAGILIVGVVIIVLFSNYNGFLHKKANSCGYRRCLMKGHA